jgi:hypothetical protein
MFGFVHIVSCDENRRPLCREVADNLPKLPSGSGVDAAGRLIEKENAGSVD